MSEFRIEGDALVDFTSAADQPRLRGRDADPRDARDLAQVVTADVVQN